MNYISCACISDENKLCRPTFFIVLIFNLVEFKILFHVHIKDMVVYNSHTGNITILASCIFEKFTFIGKIQPPYSGQI